MQETQMKIETRTGTGKGFSRKLRAAGRIPGVVYGRGVEPVAISLEPKALTTAISGEGGLNNLITLEGGGDLDKVVVIMADIQRDVIKRTPKHVDLHRVNMNEKVRVKVPISLIGTAIGVKEGGLMDFDHHTLNIECLPSQIPGHIEINISNLKIGQAIHVSEITFPAGVKCLDNPKTPVIGVLGNAKEEVVEEVEA